LYDKQPFVAAGEASDCLEGWFQIASALRQNTEGNVCIECYPGVLLGEIEQGLRAAFAGWQILRTSEAFLSPAQLGERFDGLLTDDPVFGMMHQVDLVDFFDSEKLTLLRVKARTGQTLILGTGAKLVCEGSALLVYADMARWELQRRQRLNLISNLGLANETERASLKYKRAYFLDWRAADRSKTRLLGDADYVLDTNVPGSPHMITGEVFRDGLRKVVSRPFRVVPFFDPGPWGGHWMERVCGLSTENVPNHAWCFDCVPEENSLLLGFGDQRMEIPSLDVVLSHPLELLGEDVYRRFGAEFPIRFDFLDTMGGGNLSLQVHPLKSYIAEHFGMDYTQDESYYILDAETGAAVYLGLKQGIEPVEMIAALERANTGADAFPAEEFVSEFPARKHDHFLIPAGTVHCSGKGSMVLEISATPYIFTFKLWDWGRLGLDGRPRPIHLKHGIRNIQWDRDTHWVESSLINQLQPIASGDGWREERTGLHKLEFIETRRHWFHKKVLHDTRGTVNVLNLVEGEQVIVESPTGAFAPMVVHYAETFIVPAAVGEYSIEPHGPSLGKDCATLLAYVR